MSEFIQKKCPECGAILTIRRQPGVENMTVKCPVCQESFPFMKMKDINPAPRRQVSQNNSDGTQYPGQDTSGGDSTHYEEFQPKSSQNAIGSIIVMPGNQIYQLKYGNNVIGRRSSTSSATIQINTGGSLRMSRQHLLITVANDQMGNIVHRCQLCKSQSNDTFINNAKLQFGDRVILRNGMTIQMPDATLRFIINDGDSTSLGTAGSGNPYQNTQYQNNQFQNSPDSAGYPRPNNGFGPPPVPGYGNNGQGGGGYRGY